MSTRILVSGSRDLSEPGKLWLRTQLSELALALGRLVVVQGMSGQADLTAQAWSSTAGHDSDPFPADWLSPCATNGCTPGHRIRRRDGRSYCPLAGMDRNRRMVEKGAFRALVAWEACAKPGCRRRFPHGSHGTDHAYQLVRRSGIPVRVWAPWQLVTVPRVERARPS